jgi:adenine C2-methylase RlmN of 23S rRNA A2503 and tRNA A37
MNTPSDTITDLKSLTPREIDRFCADTLGRKPGQGVRVAVWLYRRKVEEIDAMSDLNKPFREELKLHTRISKLTIDRRSASGDGT